MKAGEETDRDVIASREIMEKGNWIKMIGKGWRNDQEWAGKVKDV